MRARLPILNPIRICIRKNADVNESTSFMTFLLLLPSDRTLSNQVPLSEINKVKCYINKTTLLFAEGLGIVLEKSFLESKLLLQI